MGSKEKIYRRAGLCGGCGKVSSKSYYCEPCKEHRKAKRDAIKEERNVRTRNQYSFRLENNLCVRCGQPNITRKSTCPDCLEKKANERLARKKKCIEHYGPGCNCCGEAIFEFLTIDHIEGNGNQHRVEIGGHSGRRPHANSKLYFWLVRNNFPSGFQTLCFNCNRGKWMNGGICPHKEDNPLRLSIFNLSSPLNQQLVDLNHPSLWHLLDNSFLNDDPSLVAGEN